jgi:putative ABC transport system permease protein
MASRRSWVRIPSAPPKKSGTQIAALKNPTNSLALFNETWLLAIQALRANKMRALLTMLGVIIGSACIVLVVTIALAGKHYIISQIEAVGANIVYAEIVHANGLQTTTPADEISMSDLEAVRAAPHVMQVAGTREIPLSMTVNGAVHPISLVGVTEGFQEIRNLVVMRGRYFDHDDLASRGKVCLLTKELAASAFPSDDPVGKEIHIGELNFTVIGVFRERLATFGESEITGESVIVPFPLIRYYTGSEFIKTFYAQADQPENVSLVTSEVSDLLQNRHRAGVQYRVQNLTSILETARNISLAMTIILILVALIALTISGIGIMNIMLVTVTERTHEIGIRKALGARRGTILYQFLMEAVMVSGTGALAGIALAVLVPVLIEAIVKIFTPAEIYIPISWFSVVLAFLVSCSTGLFFGYLPASKAAHLQPTESLRYE